MTKFNQNKKISGIGTIHSRMESSAEAGVCDVEISGVLSAIYPRTIFHSRAPSIFIGEFAAWTSAKAQLAITRRTRYSGIYGAAACVPGMAAWTGLKLIRSGRNLKSEVTTRSFVFRVIVRHLVYSCWFMEAADGWRLLMHIFAQAIWTAQNKHVFKSESIHLRSG